MSTDAGVHNKVDGMYVEYYVWFIAAYMAFVQPMWYGVSYQSDPIALITTFFVSAIATQAIIDVSKMIFQAITGALKRIFAKFKEEH